jgi:hypothetical protein
VKLVERLAGRIHRLVPAPRLRDHHEDRVGQGAAVHDEELEHVVERRGVAATLTDDGEDLLQIVAQKLRAAERLTGPHPVDVASEGVDLAVVRHVAIWMSQWPRRERVGAEALVHEGEGGLHRGIGQVGVHLLDLVRAEHALVDERVRAEARDVEELPLRRVQRVDRRLDTLAQDVEAALERGAIGDPRAAAHEHLADVGLHGARGRSQVRAVRGDFAPAEEALSLLGHDALDDGPDLLALHRIAGKEHESGAILARRGKRDAEGRALTTEERVGHLDEDAGPVTGVDLASARAAVQEVDERLEALADDGVRLEALDVDHESDTAGIVLVAGVVETLGLDLAGEQ